MNNSLPVFYIEYQLCMVKELLKYVWIHVKKLIHMFSTNSKRFWSYETTDQSYISYEFQLWSPKT